ncbi:MAG: signal peptide peptidase SppA, partial [Bacteroidota bacterium]
QVQPWRDAEGVEKLDAWIEFWGKYLPQIFGVAKALADSVFINPEGLMDFKGFAAEVLYFKELQEKTGVKLEVIRHGKYKSAVEPFLSDRMSDNNREQITTLLTSLWQVVLSDIADSRNISTSSLNTIADTLGARTPEMAIATGLLDGTHYDDEYDTQWRSVLGLSETEEVPTVTLKDYLSGGNGKSSSFGSDKIAVIYAQGEILYGEGDREIIGQQTMQRAFEKVRDDDRIKAVVLRVNSPGGSSLVSDMIWREVILTKAKKPVVASFGNTAASGGYYLAAGADKIIAQSTTVTGSIGVFGTIPNIHEFAKDIGVNAEQVGTNKNSIDYSLFEPMTDTFRQQLTESIEQTYQTFLQRVADGRNMTLAEVDSIAQGRVWSGTEALSLGLIDELGDLNTAVTMAAEMAGIEDYSIRNYPKYPSEIERLLEDFDGTKLEIGEAALKTEIGDEAFETLKALQRITQQKGVQARLPFNLNIQ